MWVVPESGVGVSGKSEVPINTREEWTLEVKVSPIRPRKWD